MERLNLIGLILNVAGSVLFLIDSSRLSTLMAGMVHKMAETYGKRDSSINRPSPDHLKTLENSIVQSKWFTISGSILLGLGFILQLIHEIKQ